MEVGDSSCSSNEAPEELLKHCYKLSISCWNNTMMLHA